MGCVCGGEGRCLWMELGETVRSRICTGSDAPSHGYDVPHQASASSLLHLEKPPLHLRYWPSMVSGASCCSRHYPLQVTQGPFSGLLGCSKPPLCLEVLFFLDFKAHKPPAPHQGLHR